MKKANKKTIEKLKPYWKKYQEKREVFDREIIQLEKEMNDNSGLKTELEFFYVDGSCVGIGASYYEDRTHFPLVQDSELDES